MKIYLNHTTTERGTNATEAMSWHRAGDMVQVLTYDENGKELSDVMLEGAPQPRKMDDNTAHCKHIATEADAYASGHVRKCPDCGEDIHRTDWDEVGDLFKCPSCGAVGDPDWWDVLSIWDFLTDSLDVAFTVGSDKRYRSARIMVAYGGPNIYLDTATKAVELYWWTESARWPLSGDTVEALDDWAEEYWGCM